MSSNYGYRKTKKQNKRGFTPDIRPDINAKLEIYCHVNNKNKTRLVNEIINGWLDEKFLRLREM